MADIITLGDVSTKDAGSGSELKTGGRRKHNMPKACVKMKMKEGMSRSAAVKACYPKGKPSGFPAGSQAETERKSEKLTQSNVKNSFAKGLSLSEEDALRAQIFGCWSVPLGLPFDEELLVRIKLKLKPDGTVLKSEILDHARMNTPGQSFYRVLAESALRAIRICQPLKVPPTGYERWKNLQLNFDPTEMLKG